MFVRIGGGIIYSIRDMSINLNMFFSCAIAVIILFIGDKLYNRFKILNYFSIPIPVIGGLIFLCVTSILHFADICDFEWDMTLKDCFMLLFYSGIGFTANMKELIKGGKTVIVFLILSIILACLQNILGIGVSKLLNIDPLIGLTCSSVSMTGGHGTSSAFSPVFETAGLNNAISISLAAATFGLVSGNLIGGPCGEFLIRKTKQLPFDYTKKEFTAIEIKSEITEKGLFKAICYLLIAISLGDILSHVLDLLGFTFPASVGAMLASGLIINLKNKTTYNDMPLNEIKTISSISLQIFLALSMMTIKPWQLTNLAVPMLIILLCQVVLMLLFSIFVTYRFMGRDYTAAIISSGHCGFGLGAVPTAMANMSTLTTKYQPCGEAFFVVPLVGSLFINFFNSIIITLFINIM